MTSPKIALLGAVLESNRFAPPAEKADFTSLTWLAGDALMSEARGPTPKLATEFAAFVRAMDATGTWTPVPCLLAASHPAGPVKEAVIEEIIATNEGMLRAAGPVDAIYVCNHGAMVAEHDHDPDGLLLARMREVVGPDVPVIATLDLHANISDRMVGYTSWTRVCGRRERVAVWPCRSPNSPVTSIPERHNCGSASRSVKRVRFSALTQPWQVRCRS